MDFATGFLKGFEEERQFKRSEETRKAKAKALQDVLKSISTLMEPQAQTSTSFPDIPAPTPGPGVPPLSMPQQAAPTIGAPAIGVPPAAPSFFNPPPAAPVTTTNMVTPDRQEVLRGALKAMGGVDYTPEVATSVHALLPDWFKPSQNKVVGGKLIDEAGEVVAEGKDKPSFGVSPAGWLTTVYPDGTTQEHVGVKPMQTTVQGMRGESAEKVAGIRKLQGDAANAARIKAAEIVAQGGISREAAKAKYRRDLLKYGMDLKAEADPKTIQHYYTRLLNSYSLGEADENDIAMMEYLRPIVEKQGILGMLLQGGEGGPAGATPPPWKPNVTPPPATVEKKPGFFERIFGSEKEAPAPASPGAPAPTAPALKKGSKGESEHGFTYGKTKLVSPKGMTNADIKAAMDGFQKKLKEGYSEEQLIRHLKKKGWSVK